MVFGVPQIAIGGGWDRRKFQFTAGLKIHREDVWMSSSVPVLLGSSSDVLALEKLDALSYKWLVP